LCGVASDTKSKRQADTNACRFSCTEQRQYRLKFTGQFCMQFPKNRSIDLTHHVALQKKFGFSELTLDFRRTFWYNPV
jgi:hypothetical protein